MVPFDWGKVLAQCFGGEGKREKREGDGEGKERGGSVRE